MTSSTSSTWANSLGAWFASPYLSGNVSFGNRIATQTATLAVNSGILRQVDSQLSGKRISLVDSWWFANIVGDLEQTALCQCQEDLDIAFVKNNQSMRQLLLNYLVEHPAYFRLPTTSLASHQHPHSYLRYSIGPEVFFPTTTGRASRSFLVNAPGLIAVQAPLYGYLLRLLPEMSGKVIVLRPRRGFITRMSFWKARQFAAAALIAGANWTRHELLRGVLRSAQDQSPHAGTPLRTGTIAFLAGLIRSEPVFLGPAAHKSLIVFDERMSHLSHRGISVSSSDF